MNRVHTYCRFLFVVALLAAAQPASAQSLTLGDASVGWRILRAMDAGIDGSSESFPLGWYGDVSFNLGDEFAIVGDVSGAYKSIEVSETVINTTVNSNADIKIHTFMGGLRYSIRGNPRFVPFAQVLFGMAHGSLDLEQSVITPGRPTISRSESDSSNEFAFDLGGGVTMPATENIDFRIGVSYLRIGADNGGNGFRASLGAVFPF
jgi:opacity protein-like surface antigen